MALVVLDGWGSLPRRSLFINVHAAVKAFIRKILVGSGAIAAMPANSGLTGSGGLIKLCTELPSLKPTLMNTLFCGVMVE